MKDICKEYYDRMYLCEGQKWDLEHEVRKRDWEVLQIEFKNKKPICLPKNKVFKNIYSKKQSKKYLQKNLICLRHEQQQQLHKKQLRFLQPFFNLFFFHFVFCSPLKTRF